MWPRTPSAADPIPKYRLNLFPCLQISCGIFIICQCRFPFGGKVRSCIESSLLASRSCSFEFATHCLDLSLNASTSDHSLAIALAKCFADCVETATAFEAFEIQNQQSRESALPNKACFATRMTTEGWKITLGPFNIPCTSRNRFRTGTLLVADRSK